MKYMMMLYSDETVDAVTPEILASWQEFRREAAKLARRVGGNALTPAATATVVSVRNGKTVVTDGPFLDTKEQLGGYNVFECESLEVAVKVASMFPYADRGRIEVRPVVEFGGQG